MDQNPTTKMHFFIEPSYDALPLSVKRCFVSFALFPEDAFLKLEDLMALWSSWQLLPGIHAWTAARSFLYILLDSSLILYSCEHRGYHMHDTIRALAIKIARHESDTYGLSVFIQVCSC